ncbi:hypothetical protein, partial [Thermoanaerobacterium thermosaccharolyticum]|uniref:hypothetical protein n=1 Tax=Thermoanaerobacterium thermosaccharolyticum TaxID=1517 RepID=UPI001CE2F30B
RKDGNSFHSIFQSLIVIIKIFLSEAYLEENVSLSRQNSCHLVCKQINIIHEKANALIYW